MHSLRGGDDILLDWLPRVLEIASYGFACLGLLGVSMLVAFTADVIQVATLHLHMCHVVVAAVVHSLRLSTSTLWNLFQGKVYFAFGQFVAYTLARKVL